MSNKFFFATVALVATSLVGVQSSNAQSFPATFGANVNGAGGSSSIGFVNGDFPKNESDAKIEVSAFGPNGAAGRASVGSTSTASGASSFGVGAGGTNGKNPMPMPLTGPGAGGSFNTSSALDFNNFGGQATTRIGGGTTTTGTFAGKATGSSFSNAGSFGAFSNANFNAGGSGGTASAGGLGAQGQP
jgi:hypothetical protein